MLRPGEVLSQDLEDARLRYQSDPGVESPFHHPTSRELQDRAERRAFEKYYAAKGRLWVGDDPGSTIGQLADEKITWGSHRPAPLSESVELDLEYGARSPAAELLQKVGIFFARGAENFSSPRAFRAAVRAAAEHGVEVAIGESTPREWKGDFGMTPSQALALLNAHISGNADPVFNQILAGHELSAKPTVMPVPPAEGSAANDPQRLVALFPNGRLTRREAREFAARQQVIDAGTHTAGEIAGMVHQVDAMQSRQLNAAFEQSVQAAHGQMAQALDAIARGVLGRETVNHQVTITRSSHSASGSGDVNRNLSSRGARTSHSHGQKRSGELGFDAQQPRQIAGSADQVMLGPGAGPAGSFPSLAVVPAQTALGPTGGLGMLRQQAFGNTGETVGGRGRLAASDWQEVREGKWRQNHQTGRKFDYQVESASSVHAETLNQRAEWNIPPGTEVKIEAHPVATVRGQHIDSFKAAAGRGGQKDIGPDFARASGGDGPVAASYVTVSGGEATASAYFAMTISRR